MISEVEAEYLAIRYYHYKTARTPNEKRAWAILLDRSQRITGIVLVTSDILSKTMTVPKKLKAVKEDA